MSATTGPPRRTEQWVSLVDGVRVSRRWMTQHTPRLFATWCEAARPERRRAVATLILQIAAEVESEPPEDTAQPSADPAWRTTADQIDPRLVHGPDWPPLAAALARAAAVGYDVTSRLPALAAAAPLPQRHAARELHWRLLDDCPAALPPAGDGRPHPDTAEQPAVHSPPGCPPISLQRPTARHGGEASTAAWPTDQGEPQP